MRVGVWLFQGNPDRFDIDGYLAAELATITWLVRQHRDQIQIGDIVFLWKALGGEKGTGGVVAECRVSSAVEVRPEDPASTPFWKGEATLKPEPRVELLVMRVARGKEVLKREWLKEDPVLRELPIFKMAQGTNYSVDDAHRPRLRTLWDQTGKVWSYRDAVAGLWAYADTKGGEVSKLPGSPVARTALATGRAVGGVYNKVMNFRSIDPSPPVAATSTLQFVRNPLVVAIARLRAGSKCEVPGCSVPTFVADANADYCEVHHVTPLSEGGEDSIENAICLCPVHHREAHHGKERKSLRAIMLNMRAGGA